VSASRRDIGGLLLGLVPKQTTNGRRKRGTTTRQERPVSAPCRSCFASVRHIRKHHKTKQPKPRNKCFQPNDKRTHVWLSQPSTTLCLLRTACVLLLLRVFRWAPMQGSRSRGASSERRTQPPARGPRLCGGGLVSRCSPFVATLPPFFSDVRVLFKKVTTRLLATYSLTPVCLLFLTPLVEIPHIKTIAVSRERIEVAPASTRCPERAAWP